MWLYNAVLLLIVLKGRLMFYSILIFKKYEKFNFFSKISFSDFLVKFHVKVSRWPLSSQRLCWTGDTSENCSPGSPALRRLRRNPRPPSPNLHSNKIYFNDVIQAGHLNFNQVYQTDFGNSGSSHYTMNKSSFCKFSNSGKDDNRNMFDKRFNSQNICMELSTVGQYTL